MVISTLALISLLPGIYALWYATQLMYKRDSIWVGMPLFLLGLSIVSVGAVYFYDLLYTGWHVVLVGAFAFSTAYVFLSYIHEMQKK